MGTLSKVLFALSILTCSYAGAYANDGPESLAGDLKLAKEFFLEGKKLYEAKDFEGALEAFRKSLYEDPNNLLLNHLIGQTAYELEDYEEAVFAYERALVLDPNYSMSRLEKARTHLALGSRDEAKKEFELVLSDPNLPADVRKNVEGVLAGAGQEREHDFGLIISASHTFDSNATLGTGESFPAPFNPSFVNTPTKRSDRIAALAIVLTHAYPLDWHSLTWKNSAIAYISDNDRINTNDLFLWTLSTGFVYGGWNKQVLETYISWTNLKLKWQLAQNNLRFIGKHLWQFQDQWQLLNQVAYTRRHHFQGTATLPPATSGGHVYEGKTAINYQYDKFRSVVAHALVRYDETPAAAVGINKTAFTRYEVAGFYTRALYGMFTVTGGGIYRWDDFRFTDILSRKRCDNGYVISLGGTAKVHENIILGATVEFADNDSNTVENNYQSARVTTTATAVF